LAHSCISDMRWNVEEQYLASIIGGVARGG
jgi:hypothetical protein